jgi:hypothetical protein
VEVAMSKLAFVLPLVLLSMLLAAPLRAESMSCSSVNGTTLCSRGGSTSCQSVNGKTTCCETIGNRTECHDASSLNPPRRARPPEQDQTQPPPPPDDDDAPPPLLLPDRNVDISATILSLLLLNSVIHPAVQSIVPIVPNAPPSPHREIILAKRIRHNQEMLLLAGKLPARRCGAKCGALNSVDRRHRP